MNKEMLDIVNDLSRKPTTELALQIMELSGENLILEQQCKKQKEVIDKINIFLNNHDKNAGKLYYKYNNKYLLSEIKEDIRNILKEVLE
jgi:hypothetical protein